MERIQASKDLIRLGDTSKAPDWLIDHELKSPLQRENVLMKITVNKQKRQSPKNPAYEEEILEVDLLFKKLLSPISCKTNQPRREKKHGGGFGDWRS